VGRSGRSRHRRVTLPKGAVDDGEECSPPPLRDFRGETGTRRASAFLPLGSVRQPRQLRARLGVGG
jgi:hypothetical protein